MHFSFRAASRPNRIFPLLPRGPQFISLPPVFLADFYKLVYHVNFSPALHDAPKVPEHIRFFHLLIPWPNGSLTLAEATTRQENSRVSPFRPSFFVFFFRCSLPLGPVCLFFMSHFVSPPGPETLFPLFSCPFLCFLRQIHLLSGCAG